MRKLLFVTTATAIATLSSAQSFNVDFNWVGVGTVPNSSYAAAGLAGTWNSASIAGGSIVNMPLVDLSGSSTSVVLDNPFFFGSIATSGPWTGGNQSLMEDVAGSVAQMSTTFSNLSNGNYTVIVYGQNATGNSNSLFTVGSTVLTTGGAWTGSHLAGNSFAQFNAVPVTGGTLTIRSEGNFNGVQLIANPVPEPVSVVALTSGLIGIIARRRKSNR